MRVRSGGAMGAVGSLFLVVGPAAASGQAGPSARAATTVQGGPDAALGGALITLLVGGLLLAVKRSFADSVTSKVRSEPGRSFLVGFVTFLAVIGFLFLGFATRILIIFAYPVFIAFVLLALVGAVLAYLAIGHSLVDGVAGALLVATVVGALIAGIPVLGGLVGFVVGSIGTGAVINHVRDGDGESRFGQTGVSPGPKQY